MGERRNLRGVWFMSGIVIGGLVTVLAWSADPATEPAAKLFQKHCVQCHGKNGRGVASMAKIIKVDPPLLDLSREEVRKAKDEELLKSITEGKNKQPGFKAKLSEEERKTLLHYVRKLTSAGGPQGKH